MLKCGKYWKRHQQEYGIGNRPGGVAAGEERKMGLCKCTRCPPQGKFVVGRYYAWRYSIAEKFFWKKGRHVTDEQGDGYTFSPRGFASCFKEMEAADLYMGIYIDRKRELIFVPKFKYEAGYHVSLDRFERLPFPYEAEEVGKTLLAVWEAYREHPVVSAEEKEHTTPYYKIITKGKGIRAFSERRWMICVTFITSENEIILEYWYRKKGGAFGRDTTDRNIGRIIKLSAGNETIGNAVLDVFGEAGVP